MSKRRRIIQRIISVGIMIFGLSMIVYLKAAERQGNAYVSYLTANTKELLKDLDESTVNEMYSDAVDFNKTLLTIPNRRNMSEELTEQYEACLDISGTGLMGTIDIPTIDTHVPIYHGTASRVLQAGAGHMEGSSLPIGGPNTHAVLAAHTGTIETLFTKLDEMTIGDIFYINILEKTLCYKVSDIKVVLPTETQCLEIQPEKDLVTLITCTPPGINSHRLVVTGERTETENVIMRQSKRISHMEIWFVCGLSIFSIVIGYMIRKSMK